MMSRLSNCIHLVVGCALILASACSDRLQRQPPEPTRPKRAKIRISWTVQSSQDLYGFNIYRGRSPEGPWVLVNPTPVLAAEGGTTNIPHDYQYIDTDESLVIGERYWYWLEAVENNGNKRKVWWPPKSVVAKVGINEDFPSSGKERK